MVVQTHSFDLLYDAGPSWTDQSDAGQRIVVPYLRATGARLGGMVVSHEDSDHAGGVPAVRRERPPQWVRSSYARTPEERCVAGERWEWDGVRFAFVHPSARMYDSKRKSNDVSCVLRIEGSDGSSALLTGDVEALAEHEMVGGTAQLSAALLTVPHHGSLTSSTDSFIAAVSPQRAIVNAGYRNRFGHPRPEVLQRYLRRNIPVDRTDLHGAVKYVWRDGQWLPERWREANRRYWHHAP
jgi:competence protein ComEC